MLEHSNRKRTKHSSSMTEKVAPHSTGPLPHQGDTKVTSVAFIGLGNMGSGMAQRLLDAGFELRVYNRTRSKAATLEKAGARVCGTPREACDGAAAVLSMTADDGASRSIWLGQHGVLAATLGPKAFAIECSTLSYDWVMELAGQVRAHDLRYIDAPVT